MLAIPICGHGRLSSRLQLVGKGSVILPDSVVLAARTHLPTAKSTSLPYGFGRDFTTRLCGPNYLGHVVVDGQQKELGLSLIECISSVLLALCSFQLSGQQACRRSVRVPVLLHILTRVGLLLTLSLGVLPGSQVFRM